MPARLVHAKRQRVGRSMYPSDVWETEANASSSRVCERLPSLPLQEKAHKRAESSSVCTRPSKIVRPSLSGDNEGQERTMGGLSLPDVVRELLKERSVLRWDEECGVYEVQNGEHFEAR